MENSNDQLGAQYKPQPILSTPLAILLAGIFISVAVLYSQGDLPFVTNSKKLEESKYGKYLVLAKELGMDQKKFNACLEKEDASEITKDVSDATAAGISGTPAFVIGQVQDNGINNAILIPGAFPEPIFSLILDTYLQGGQAELEAKLLEVVNSQVDPSSKVTDLSSFGIRTNIQIGFDDDAVLGNKDAKVAIVEFSDYECPYCQKYFKETYKAVKQKYVDNGSVKLVFRDFPLSIHDPMATEAARAVNCAREQKGDEGYYSYHDAYFNKTKSNGQGL